MGTSYSYNYPMLLVLYRICALQSIENFHIFIFMKYAQNAESFFQHRETAEIGAD